MVSFEYLSFGLSSGNWCDKIGQSGEWERPPEKLIRCHFELLIQMMCSKELRFVSTWIHS